MVLRYYSCCSATAPYTVTKQVIFDQPPQITIAFSKIIAVGASPTAFLKEKAEADS